MFVLHIEPTHLEYVKLLVRRELNYLRSRYDLQGAEVDELEEVLHALTTAQEE